MGSSKPLERQCELHLKQLIQEAGTSVAIQPQASRLDRFDEARLMRAVALPVYS
jgi:hypothetical protein